MRYELCHKYFETTEHQYIIMSKKTAPKTDSEKLDEIIRLLKLSNALELQKLGVPQQQIAKTIGTATAAINQMLKGINKD